MKVQAERLWRGLVYPLAFLVVSLILVADGAANAVGQDSAELGGHTVAAIAWSPDGTQLAVGQGLAQCSQILNDPRYTVEVFDAASGEILHRFMQLFCLPHAIAWNPNGNMLAIGSNDRGLWLWDVETGHVTDPYQPTAFLSPDFIAWHPDGQMLALKLGYHIDIYDTVTHTSFRLDTQRERGRIAALA